MSPANKPEQHSLPVARFESVRVAVGAVVRRLVGSRDPEYEDVVQSSLLNVLATLDDGKFRGDCPTGGWAAVIARNVAVDTIRARARERRIFTNDDAAPADADELPAVDAALSPERLTELRRMMDQVHEALARMGPDKASVIYLHDLLGYPLAEVAEMVGTSIAAAQSRLVRGRREIIETIGVET
jgi:RNA polymerase sigma-70 factor, ECF subfamily